MSAKDVFHEVVKKALQKDGWQITHDPLSISVGGVNLSIDLAAEKLIAAEREGEKIAVEIKSFLERSSAISEFHTALGQFLNYQIILEETQSERELYLAVPNDTYISFFQTRLAKIAVEKYNIKIIVYDPIAEVIVKWQI